MAYAFKVDLNGAPEVLEGFHPLWFTGRYTGVVDQYASCLLARGHMTSSMKVAWTVANLLNLPQITFHFLQHASQAVDVGDIA